MAFIRVMARGLNTGHSRYRRTFDTQLHKLLAYSPPFALCTDPFPSVAFPRQNYTRAVSLGCAFYLGFDCG